MTPAADALRIASEEFTRFLEPEGTLAVAVGGSVARGEAAVGSDIDLLVFSSRTKLYRKDHAIAQGWKLEIHRIPELLPVHLAKKASPLLEPTPALDFAIVHPHLEGEKSCPLAPRPTLSSLLGAWRELRKMLDAVPLMQELSWFDALRNRLSALRGERTAFANQLAALGTGTEDLGAAAVTALKLDALRRGTVFSKALWSESYLQARGSVDLELHFSATVLGAERSIADKAAHLVWLDTMLPPISTYVAAAEATPLSCDVCQGLPARCNTTRCAKDFLNDARLGIARGWPLGATLSLRSAVEYSATRLSNNLNAMHIAPEWSHFWEDGTAARRRSLQALLATVLEEGSK